MSLMCILSKYNKIIIPDVQRDYVMGSGGKKFLELLAAMAASAEKKEKFNFSCLVSHCDENNYLYIYDGQQRLATLVYLCAYLTNDSNINEMLLLNKFSFTGRDLANQWLKNPKEIDESKAVDFTTYSLAKLIEAFSESKLPSCKWSDKISLDFLFKNVIFDMILVDKISDAEQFFLDINDGLDLKSYEVFKAELFHHAGRIMEQPSFKKFALKVENKWLQFFLPYSHKDTKWIEWKRIELVVNCEEEMLMFFLQYCFRMMWIEENGDDNDYQSKNVSWLTLVHLERLESILDAIVDKVNSNETTPLSCINQSECSNIYSSEYCRGQHWNISDKNYVAMLKKFLQNVYNSNETKKDVVIWCYISKLPLMMQGEDELHKYLRFIKKILNHNRKSCNDAKVIYHYYRIKYIRYYTVGVPQYYTDCKNEKLEDKQYDFLNSVIMLNKESEFCCKLFNTNEYIKSCKNELLENILLNELKKLNSQKIENIEQYEDLSFINGQVDNFLIYTEDSCSLQKFCDDSFYSQLNEIKLSDYQYKEILKFIELNSVDIKKTLFKDIIISWDNYCGTTHKQNNCGMIPHTWCDLFTSENGMPLFEETLGHQQHIFPDGWVSVDWKIMEPQETERENRKGFAAWGKIHEVWDIDNF